jgi:hypothetical protein
MRMRLCPKHKHFDGLNVFKRAERMQMTPAVGH